MSAQRTPTQVVESSFAALERRDWQTLATLVHTAALNSLRQENLGLLILVAEDRKAGKEGGGYNPGDVVIADRLPRVGSERVPKFQNNPTISELASLSAAEFFIRWCAAVYGSAIEDDPVRQVVGLQRRIIGEVREGDSLSHVLYRREGRHISMNELFIDLPGGVAIMPLQNVKGEWKLVLNNDIGSSLSLELVPSRMPLSTRGLKRTTRVYPKPDVAPLLETKVHPGPAETARLAFAAFESHDWRGLAAFIDSARLVEFQREELAYLVAWLSSKEARAESVRRGHSVFMLSYDDSLSAEVIAQFATTKVPVFPNAPTIRELADLSPAAFFALWCQAAYEPAPDGNDRAPTSQLRRKIVGEVYEGDTRAHVLYRSDRLYGTPWPIGRMPLRVSERGWGLLLNEDIGWTIHLSMRLERK